MPYVTGRPEQLASDPRMDNVAALAVALGKVDAAHRRLRTRIARELGITVADLTALIVISDSEKITPKLLAAELGHTSGAVTAMIDRLAAAGQVARAPKVGDRRSILISLTLEGSATIAIVWQHYITAIAVAAQISPRLIEHESLNSLRRTAEAIDGSRASDEIIPLSA